MNMRENFQNLSLNHGSRQASLHEQGPLPGVDHILATRYDSLPPGRKPHGYVNQRPAAPAAYNYAQFPQAHPAVHYAYAHTSIEASTPPTALSSPRGMYNDHGSDTSSYSSGSRESSTCPRGSVMSNTATDSRSAWSTRTKRGSESQGSGSDRSTKRADSSKGEMYCEECECPIDDCSEPRVHKARVKKIVKEKSSRSNQASILQGHEDLTQNALNIRGYKIQQPGNKKKSGMLYDKKEILVSTQIALDEAIKTVARLGGPQGYDDWVRATSERIDTHLIHGSQSGLPANSLMSGTDGEGPCIHQLHRVKCEDYLECRKSTRSVHYKNNLNQILDSAPRSAAHQLSAGSRSSSSTPRRR